MGIFELIEDLDMYDAVCEEAMYGKHSEQDKRELNKRIDEYRMNHPEEF